MTDEIKEILNDDDKFKQVVKLSFDVVDTDKSGLIDYNELREVVNQMARGMKSGPPSKKDVQEVLDHLDVDHNGKIDFEEFSELVRDVLNAMLEEEESN